MSAEAINSAPTRTIEKLIKSSGYFRQKTKKLKSFVRYLIDKYNGDLKKFFSGNVAAKRKELLSLYGIGKETADSILLYAGNKKVFVVDAYTRRFIRRLGYQPARLASLFGLPALPTCSAWQAGVAGGGIEGYDAVQKIFVDQIPKSAIIYNEFHALIVELSKHYCKKDPLCSKCPLKKICLKAI